MSKAATKLVTFRLPADLLQRVEEYGARREAAEPGLELPTTILVRVLLERGLRVDAPGSDPESATRQVAFRLPEELLARVRAYGERADLSLTGAVRVLLEAGLHADVASAPRSRS